MNILSSIFDEPLPQVEPEPAATPASAPVVSKCKGCGKSIWWMTTAAGKAIPLDDEIEYVSPNGNGKRLMLFGADGKVVNGFECKKNAAGSVAGRRSHFASCPNANKFRRQDRKD